MSCRTPIETRAEQSFRPAPYSTDEGTAVGAWVLLEAGPKEGARKPERARTRDQCSKREAFGLFIVKGKLIHVRVLLRINTTAAVHTYVRLCAPTVRMDMAHEKH